MMVLIRDEDILYEVRMLMSALVALGIAQGQEDAWRIVKEILHNSLKIDNQEEDNPEDPYQQQFENINGSD